GQGRSDGEGGRRRRRRRGRRGGRGRREDGQTIQPAGFGPQPEGDYGQPYVAPYQPPPSEPHDESDGEVRVEPPRPAEPRPPRPPIDVVPPWRKQQQTDAQPSPPPQPEARR